MHFFLQAFDIYFAFLPSGIVVPSPFPQFLCMRVPVSTCVCWLPCENRWTPILYKRFPSLKIWIWLLQEFHTFCIFTCHLLFLVSYTIILLPTFPRSASFFYVNNKRSWFIPGKPFSVRLVINDSHSLYLPLKIYSWPVWKCRCLKLM